jgi:hypothetical protein
LGDFLFKNIFVFSLTNKNRDKGGLMSVIFVGNMNVPNYLINTTDMELDGTVTGISKKGNTVLDVDTSLWYVVDDDLVLQNYALPISFNGSVDIGAVHLDQNISESVEVGFFHDTKSVAVPGTAESLTSTDVYVVSVAVYPKTASTNVGNIYFGNSAVDRATSKQFIITPTNSGIGIDVSLGNKLNLKSLFIDADNAGDGVEFNYLK